MGLMGLQAKLIIGAIIVFIVLLALFWQRIKNAVVRCDAGHGSILCVLWHYSPFRFIAKLLFKAV
jgi:predicted branched-subunit amino acid permease